jgi:hypothetical protein
MSNALKRNASAICLGGDVSEANMAISGLHMPLLVGLARSSNGIRLGSTYRTLTSFR